MTQAPRRQEPTAHRQAACTGRAGFMVGAVLLVAAVALALVVKAHPGPLPDDVQLELADQHLLLPHQLLATALDQVSRVNWPTPAGIVVGTVFVLLLLLRRWLAALTAAGASIFGDLTSYLTNQVVQRPRPAGHGIVVHQQITHYFGFPSGHVVHVTAFFGMLLFLTFQTRRWPALRGLLRLAFLLLLVLIGPSRVMEGEHWPSDVLEGLLVGAFWLLLAVHGYWWAGARWPRLLAPDERAARAARRGGGCGLRRRSSHSSAAVALSED
jgi:membrane-associated phospholipid phosphatase